MSYFNKSKFAKPNRLNKKLVIIGLLIIIVVIVIIAMPKSNSSNQLVCQPTTLPEKFEQADLIVSGKVFLVLADGPQNAKVLFSADRVYKGEIPKFGITIAAKQDTAITNASSNGELHFATDNQEYLLFLKSSSGGLYTTSRCFGSREFGNGLSAEETQVLGQGQVVKPD
jgi:hypothetical protein